MLQSHSQYNYVYLPSLLRRVRRDKLSLLLSNTCTVFKIDFLILSDLN